MKTPKVSVVMPTYNHSELISNAVNSILNQTLPEWELIVVDDGSNDNTQFAIGKFKDERIRYIRLAEHKGIVNARNLGNSFAKADIIALQDSDDLSMPDRMEKCFNEMHLTGADVLYHGLYVNMWDKQYNCIGRKYVPAKHFNKYDLLKGQFVPGICTFRKKCWEMKPYRMETQYAFDWMMHLDWAFSGFTYRALDLGLYEYVRHENSASITFERNGLRKQSMEKIAEIMQSEYKQKLVW